ncbi:MAG: hypothetical protein HQL51_07790 [Magnetococcales bacterium]|nr:hypothetical protein [Magnetococcales bacterium]
MDNRIQPLLERLREIQQQIELELERQRKNVDFILAEGKVWFSAPVLRQHLQFRLPLLAYLRRARWSVVLSAPFIYVLIVPFALLDFFLWVYQAICFPIYGLPKVRRGDYIFVDRGALAYLNLIEKINCLYCGYGVGLMALGREVASRTEAYWCPIKHARKIQDPHPAYFDFAEFGDPEGYRRRLRAAREPGPQGGARGGVTFR